MTTAALVAAALAAWSAALAAGPARHVPSAVESAARPGSASPLRWRWAAALAAFVGATMIVGGALGAGAGALAAIWLWRLLGGLESRAERAHRELLERRAPLLADLVADALSAGADPSGALRVAAEAVGEPLAAELAVVTARLDLGAEPDAVWRMLAGHPQLGPIGRAFVRASQTGSSVTASMRRSAEDLRAHQRSTREAEARSVAVKAAGPLGAFLLPAFVLVGIVPVVAGALQQLLH